MTTYLIQGADKDNGTNRMLDIDALDQKAAEREANLQGILVSASYVKETQSEKYLKQIAFWVKFWSVLILIIFGLWFFMFVITALQRH